MSADVEARTLLIDIAGPLRLGESVKVVLSRVARLTGLGERRVRGIWNGEARAIRAEEMDALRAAARDAQLEEDSRREYRTALARIAAIEATLGLSRQDLDGARPDALGDRARGAHRALDRGQATGVLTSASRLPHASSPDA